MDNEEIATLLVTHKNAGVPQTNRASAAMNTAAAVVSDMLTTVYSADADWVQVIIELGAETTSTLMEDGREDGVMRVAVRLGPMPESVLDLTVPEAVVVILDRACMAVVDFWNASFEAEGLFQRASADRLFWDAISRRDDALQFGRIMRLAGPASETMERWINR